MLLVFQSNKSLPGDIHVRVRRGVVQIPVEQPGIAPVVPIPAEVGKKAHSISL